MTNRLLRVFEFVTRDPEVSVIFSDNKNKGIPIYNKDGVTVGFWLEINYFTRTCERQLVICGLEKREEYYIRHLMSNANNFPLKELSVNI